MALGTLALHQLRYLVGYHGHADAALASNGHAYLASLVPAMAGVTLLTLAALIRLAARGASPAPRFARTWAGSTLGVAAVYCLQELAEGAPVAGQGGWVAVPLATAIGLLIAVVMRGASAAGELAVPRRPWRPPAPCSPGQPPAARPATFPHGALPLRLSARAPPALSV
jgi:hypothetical protein